MALPSAICETHPSARIQADQVCKIGFGYELVPPILKLDQHSYEAIQTCRLNRRLKGYSIWPSISYTVAI